MPPSPHLIGTKVVCVHDFFTPAVYEAFDSVPLENHVYTIEDVFWGIEVNTGRQMLSVRLVEIPPILAGWGGFSLWRFRLLEDHRELRRQERARGRRRPLDSGGLTHRKLRPSQS